MKLICKLVTCMAIVLGVANIVVSNKLSTQGKDLSKINDAILSEQKNNAFLEEEIAQYTALSKIEAAAVAQGYVSISKPVALAAPAPVAYVSGLQQ